MEGLAKGAKLLKASKNRMSWRTVNGYSTQKKNHCVPILPFSHVALFFFCLSSVLSLEINCFLFFPLCLFCSIPFSFLLFSFFFEQEFEDIYLILLFGAMKKFSSSNEKVQMARTSILMRTSDVSKVSVTSPRVYYSNLCLEWAFITLVQMFQIKNVN